MTARIRLGELLVRAGVLDELKLSAALAEQQRWGGRLGRILVEMGFVSEDLLVKALSKQLGIPRADFKSMNVPRDILEKIDPEFARANAVCPDHYDAQRKVLTLAMADPTNYSAADAIRFKTGLRIDTKLAGDLQISKAIDQFLVGRRRPMSGIELPDGDDSVMRAAVDARAMAAPHPQAPSHPTPPPPVRQNVSSGTPYAPSGPPTPSTGNVAYSPSAGTIGPPTVRMQALPPASPTNPMLSARPTATSASSSAAEMAAVLDAAQRKQQKAIRAMLELLIEKGVFSADEYMRFVGRS